MLAWFIVYIFHWILILYCSAERKQISGWFCKICTIINYILHLFMCYVQKSFENLASSALYRLELNVIRWKDSIQAKKEEFTNRYRIRLIVFGFGVSLNKSNFRQPIKLLGVMTAILINPTRYFRNYLIYSSILIAHFMKSISFKSCRSI